MLPLTPTLTLEVTLRGFPRAAFLRAQPWAGCGVCAGGTGLWLLSVKLQVPVGVQVPPKPT